MVSNAKDENSNNSKLSNSIYSLLRKTMNFHIVSIILIIFEYVPLIHFSTDLSFMKYKLNITTNAANTTNTTIYTNNVTNTTDHSTPSKLYESALADLMSHLIFNHTAVNDESSNTLLFNYICYILILLVIILFMFLYFFQTSYLLAKKNNNQSEVLILLTKISTDVIYFVMKVFSFHIMYTFWAVLLNLNKYDANNSIITENIVNAIISGILLLVYAIFSILYNKIAENYLFFLECNLYPNFHGETTFLIIEKTILSLVYTFSDKLHNSLNMCCYIFFSVFSFLYLYDSHKRFIHINNSYTNFIKFTIRAFVFLNLCNMIFCNFVTYQTYYNSIIVSVCFLFMSLSFSIYIHKKTIKEIENFSFDKDDVSIISTVRFMINNKLKSGLQNGSSNLSFPNLNINNLLNLNTTKMINNAQGNMNNNFKQSIFDINKKVTSNFNNSSKSVNKNQTSHQVKVSHSNPSQEESHEDNNDEITHKILNLVYYYSRCLETKSHKAQFINKILAINLKDIESGFDNPFKLIKRKKVSNNDENLEETPFLENTNNNNANYETTPIKDEDIKNKGVSSHNIKKTTTIQTNNASHKENNNLIVNNKNGMIPVAADSNKIHQMANQLTQEIESNLNIQEILFIFISESIKQENSVLSQLVYNIIQIIFLENYIGSIISFTKSESNSISYNFSIELLYEFCIEQYSHKIINKEQNSLLSESTLEAIKLYKKFEVLFTEIVNFKFEFLSLVNSSHSTTLQLDIITRFSEKFGKLKNEIEVVLSQKQKENFKAFNDSFILYEMKFYYSLILKDRSYSKEIILTKEKVLEDFSEEAFSKQFFVTVKYDNINDCWRFFSFSNIFPNLIKLSRFELLDANINVLLHPLLKKSYHSIISKQCEANPSLEKMIYPINSKNNLMSFYMNSKIMPRIDMSLYISCSFKNDLENYNSIVFMVGDDGNKILSFSTNASNYFGLNTDILTLLDLDFFELFGIDKEYLSNQKTKSYDKEINVAHFYRLIYSKLKMIRKDNDTRDIFLSFFDSDKGKNLLKVTYSVKCILSKQTNFSYLNNKDNKNGFNFFEHKDLNDAINANEIENNIDLPDPLLHNNENQDNFVGLQNKSKQNVYSTNYNKAKVSQKQTSPLIKNSKKTTSGFANNVNTNSNKVSSNLITQKQIKTTNMNIIRGSTKSNRYCLNNKENIENFNNKLVFENEIQDSQEEEANIKNLDYYIIKLIILNTEEVFKNEDSLDLDRKMSIASRDLMNEGASMISTGSNFNNKRKIYTKRTDETTNEIDISGLLKTIYVFNSIIIFFSFLQIIILFIVKSMDNELTHSFIDSYNGMFKDLHCRLTLQNLIIGDIFVMTKDLHNSNTDVGSFLDFKENLVDIFKTETNELNSLLTNKLNEYYTDHYEDLNFNLTLTGVLPTGNTYDYSVYYNQYLYSTLVNFQTIANQMSSADLSLFNLSTVLNNGKSDNLKLSLNSYETATIFIIKNTEDSFQKYLSTMINLNDDNIQSNYDIKMRILIGFFVTFVIIKSSFYCFLFLKTYILFNLFKKNLKKIEKLSVTRIKNDLETLMKLKHNLKYFFQKKDFTFFVKKVEDANRYPGGKGFKATNQNQMMGSTINVLQNNKDTNSNTNVANNNKNQNTNLLASSDRKLNNNTQENQLLNQNAHKTDEINMLPLGEKNIYNDAGSDKNLKQLNKPNKKEDQKILLDMDSLNNMNSVSFSIYSSLFINILYYVIFYIISSQLFKGFLASNKFCSLNLQKSMSVYKIVVLSQNVFLRPFEFDLVNINDTYSEINNLNKKIIEIEKNEISSSLFSFLDLSKLYNLTRSTFSGQEEYFTGYDSEDNFNSSLAKVSPDLYQDFLKTYISVFEINILSEFNDIMIGINETLIDTGFYSGNKNFTLVFPILDTLLDSYVFDKFNLLDNLYNEIINQKITYFEDTLNKYASILTIISILFYLAIILIDIFTAFFALLVKVKENFRIIKDMNDLMCSIA